MKYHVYRYTLFWLWKTCWILLCTERRYAHLQIMVTLFLLQRPGLSDVLRMRTIKVSSSPVWYSAMRQKLVLVAVQGRAMCISNVTLFVTSTLRLKFCELRSPPQFLSSFHLKFSFYRVFRTRRVSENNTHWNITKTAHLPSNFCGWYACSPAFYGRHDRAQNDKQITMLRCCYSSYLSWDWSVRKKVLWNFKSNLSLWKSYIKLLWMLK